MFLWYKYLIVSLFFSHLGFWSGNLFLIAPFPDLCLLVPFSYDLFFLRTQYSRNYSSLILTLSLIGIKDHWGNLRLYVYPIYVIGHVDHFG